MVQWEVRIVTGGWLVSIYTTYEVWVRRIVDGTLTNEHQFVGAVFTGLPPKTFVAVERLSLTFDGDSLSKSWRVHYRDFNDNPAYFDVSVSVPPFNNQTSTTTGWHDEEIIIYLPPPPEAGPAPLPPPPIPIEPPPKVPPEVPPPVTDEPPWSPPDKPPPTFGPPDRPHPPPRLTNDYLTWNAFVAKYGDRIKRWALEVPLDYGDLPPDPNAPENYKRMWQRLTGHKADAFIDFGHVIYVAEVKPRLTLAALGQSYFGWQLAVQRYRFDKPVKPCVICSTAPHTLLPIAAQNGITVFVLEGITGGQPE